MTTILDLFSCAGGASVGYYRAGFKVVGVDLHPQPSYPFRMFQGDWLEGARYWLRQRKIDAIHASPPCQAFSLISHYNRAEHVDLIAPVRAFLQSTGLPYIIENVPQAPLLNPVTLCGTQFGLPIIRHRSFECSFPATSPAPCGYAPTARNRHAGYLAYPYGRKSWRPAWREHVLPVVWPWTDPARIDQEAGEAIPPQYSEYLGRQMMEACK